MARTLLSALLFLIALSSAAQKRYIEISKSNPSYFAFSDGTTYIPVGINMINPSGRNGKDPDSAFAEIESWMRNLSENGATM